MPVVDGQKVACQPCIRGHRVGSCNHAGERQMVPVKKPGRPLSTCPHLPGTQCDCRLQNIAAVSSSSSTVAASAPIDTGESEATTLDYATTLPFMTAVPHWASISQSVDYSFQMYPSTSPATDLSPFPADTPVLWTGSGPLKHNNDFSEDMLPATTPMTEHDSITDQYSFNAPSQNEYTVLPQSQGYWWLATEGPSSAYTAEMEPGLDQRDTLAQTWDGPSIGKDENTSSKERRPTSKEDGV
ncbi:copper fist DNA binding domain-containing protein [Triangularia verruculosa]|uniref:Copper fist DNA binding domain-containing protein n=1 Tax=Triangularia verruculosa TaxID=2587418 RepID=A0AAN6XJ13_9PEZI|nr:copper fist DNA binding domain-containing protein [Triangularia verruculosa]